MEIDYIHNAALLVIENSVLIPQAKVVPTLRRYETGTVRWQFHNNLAGTQAPRKHQQNTHAKSRMDE